jgi:hypothetical protein
MKKKANGPMGEKANRIFSVAVLLLALGSSASAQTQASEAPSLLEQAGATVTFRAGVWSSTRELDSDGPFAAGILWGKVGRPINENVSMFAEGWTSLRGPFGDGQARGELREGFVTFASGPIELRAGRQILSWGRADGINPTDNLTGQDLTLLVPDDSDRRLGATAVRASYSHRDVTATVIWLPEFRPHRLPLPAALGDLEAAESRWQPEQFAVRLEQVGGAIDWSISGYRGRDLNGDIRLAGQQASGRAAQDGVGFSLSHDMVRIFGADATCNIGRYGLRAEGAYVDTEDRHGLDPFVKNPFLFVVAGADRTIHEHMNVNVQYLYRFVTRFDAQAPGDAISQQTRRAQHGASARVSYKWMHDTLEAEVAAAGYALPRGYVMRPKVTYAVSDRMKLLLGGELYRGDAAASAFGMLRHNSGGFAEVRWSF